MTRPDLWGQVQSENMPNRPASKRQLQAKQATATQATQGVPAPFSRASERLSPFLKKLKTSNVYVVHLDTLPWQFKGKVFSVPVALNIAIAILATWRFLVIWPWYLDMMFLVLGYQTRARVPDRELKPFRELALITAGRVVTMAFDFVLFRILVPWPLKFFFEKPANPISWRWRLGFQDTEIVVRTSLRWGTAEFWASYSQAEGDETKNVILEDKIMPAIDPQYMRGRTGYLMLGKSFDLDFTAMLEASQLVKEGTLAQRDFQKTVFAYSEAHGWLAWKLHELDHRSEEEARKRIIAFKVCPLRTVHGLREADMEGTAQERLTAIGKESLFFRWIELIQYESSQPGGFTPQRQLAAMQKAKQLFQDQGVDFEAFIRSIGGVESFPGFGQAAAS